MLKVGVLGAGHLGKIHIKLLKESKAYELCGFFDNNQEHAAAVAEELGVAAYEDMDALIQAVDVVDIVTPTLAHFECAKKAIAAGKHIFIEKPVTYSLEEGESLKELVREAGVKAQIGHVERFNPAFMAAKDFDLRPMFVESHRLAQYNPRGTDVSVVLDLMIHDIDILLHLIPHEVVEVRASGVPVISDTPDIANARISFANGSIANLTASRASLKKERKMRLFQKNAYITINFLDKEVNVFKIKDGASQDNPLSMVIDAGNGQKKTITYSAPKVPEVNAIKEELERFARAISTDSKPEVTLTDGLASLRLAFQVLAEIERNLAKIQD